MNNNVLEFSDGRSRMSREHSETDTPPVPNDDELILATQHLAAAQLRQAKVPRVQEIQVDNFRSERYQLNVPLRVYLQERDDYFLAESFDTDQYGEGCSPEDAITVLCEMIEDYYDLLLEDEGNLSTALDRHLRYLRRILSECK